jgi:hypothetical protein
MPPADGSGASVTADPRAFFAAVTTAFSGHDYVNLYWTVDLHAPYCFGSAPYSRLYKAVLRLFSPVGRASARDGHRDVRLALLAPLSTGVLLGASSPGAGRLSGPPHLARENQSAPSLGA